MNDDELRALRERLHGDPAATAGTQRRTATPRAAPSRSPIPGRARGAPDRVGQGRRRQVVGDDEPRRRARAAGHAVGIIDADVWGFSIPRMLGVDRPPGRARPDAPATRGTGRALHLDRLLRRRGPAGHLAGPDAAQGARAVPHRRVLGRARLPARRPAARHRRRLDLAGADASPGPRCYVVTTPQPAAQRVAQRAGFMADKVNSR